MLTLLKANYKKNELRVLLELVEDFQCAFPETHRPCGDCELRHVCGDLNRLGKHIESILAEMGQTYTLLNL